MPYAILYMLYIYIYIYTHIHRCQTNSVGQSGSAGVLPGEAAEAAPLVVLVLSAVHPAIRPRGFQEYC